MSTTVFVFGCALAAIVNAYAGGPPAATLLFGIGAATAGAAQLIMAVKPTKQR
ncbi:hypothetical protein VR010_03060 [Actinomycetaceae bacterium L2_0104]